MIESIMYFGIGFLVAALIALVVIPLVHDRAVRLTRRRLESALPLSMAEIQADKDQLRAEFAMSTRRLEINVDQLRNKAASYFAELGTKGDVINKLKIERDAQHVENLLLKAQVKALTVGGNEVKTEDGVVSEVSQGWPNAEVATATAESLKTLTPRAHRHKGDAVSLVPKVWPIAEPSKVPIDSLPPNEERDRLPMPREWPAAETVSVPMGALQNPPPNGQRRESNIASLVPRQGLTAERVNAPEDCAHSPSPIGQDQRGDAIPHLLVRPKTHEVQSGGSRLESDGKRSSPNQCTGIAGERSDFSAELKAIEPSIRVFPGEKFASNKSSTEGPALARILVAVLIGVGVSFGWYYYGGEAMEIIKTRSLSLGWLSSVSRTNSSSEVEVPAGQTGAARAGRVSVQNTASQPMPQTALAPAAVATSPKLVQRKLQNIVRDLVAVRQSVEHLTAKQEQMANNIATPRAGEPHIKHTMSSPLPQTRAKLTPTPDTRPTTIPGWTLLKVTKDVVVLKGPNGTWRATRGDTVPGVGKVESVVRWGNRWIVATSRGLISTP
jgi:hypothetical protein